MRQVFDGFWFPKSLRQKLITDETQWHVQYHAAGRPSSKHDRSAIGARWPILTRKQWEILFEYLDTQRIPVTSDFIPRLQTALAALSQNFYQTDHSLTLEAVQIFSNYTGYSQEMVSFAMSLFEHESFAALGKILQSGLPASTKHEFTSLNTIGDIEGRLRFFLRGKFINLPAFPADRSSPLQYQENYPQTVLGYASGNVLGTAFIITLLGLVSALVKTNSTPHQQRLSPAILVKNSRQEPLFVPFLFSAIEELDPDLLGSVAIQIWDYEDTELQEFILAKADLILAAASDQTINQIENQIKRVQPSARFHKHGHKVSFTTIGKAYLVKTDTSDMIERTALLAGLDSILWDQNGCLSSRIHFVEQGDSSHYTPIEYGHKLAEKLRILSKKLPRGTIQLSSIHNRFDHFNAQAISPLVDLCSTYDDDFIVIVDRRPWAQQQFRSIVNSCMERTIVIRPVESIHQVPKQYLSQLPSNQLQTMYVAIDDESQADWSTEFARFIEDTAKLGISSIRSVGQSPFPQLAYSWDGYMPQSLSLRYPQGRFTTVEFDSNYTKINRISDWLVDRID